MKKSQLLRMPEVLISVLLTLSFSVNLTQPSSATSEKDRRLIGQTSQERNREYPQQLQVQESDSLLAAYSRAKEEVSRMSGDIPVKFPLDTNSPISRHQIPDDTGLPPEVTDDSEAIGFVDSSWQPRPITPRVLEDMFATGMMNGGAILKLEVEHILIADASRSFFQAKRIPTIDLIVYNKPTNRVYLVPKVNANAFCRDALNAVLNGTLSRNNIDLSKLRNESP